MATSEITLKFNFSYGELLAQALEKQTYLTRDSADLLPRGVTPARLTAFDGMIVAFKNTTEDGILQSLVSVAVDKRDVLQEAIMVKIRDVAGVASLALGAQSAEYRTFQYGDINKLSPAEFLIRADSICDRADAYTTQLQAKGITPAMITAIRADFPAFQTLIKDADTAKGNRDINTQNRRTVANTLYTEIVALAEIAKVYYQDRDEAKYNDYIIYNTSATAQSRTGRLAAAEVKTRELNDLNNDLYIIAELESAGKLDVYFSQSTNGGPASVFATIDGFSKKTLNVATDLGYDPNIGATHFTLKNVGTQEVVYRMRIE